MRLVSCILILLLGFVSPAAAWHTEHHDILENAALVLEEMRSSPDEGIPTKLLSKARAIVIIPNLLKGGFMFGARYGEGVATVRNPYTGKWGAPSFITSAGASFGFQAGAQAIDLVLLVMTERGLKGLLKDNFTLGGDIALTAGPVGRYAEAGTDILLQGEIYSYSRSKGLFGGVSLKGTVIQPNVDSNEVFYGKHYPAEQILIHGKLKHVPKSALHFIASVNRLAPPPGNPNQPKLASTDMVVTPEPEAKPEVKPATKPQPQAASPVTEKQREPLW